jgi:hypothetical protein
MPPSAAHGDRTAAEQTYPFDGSSAMSDHEFARSEGLDERDDARIPDGRRAARRRACQGAVGVALQVAPFQCTTSAGQHE